MQALIDSYTPVGLDAKRQPDNSNLWYRTNTNMSMVSSIVVSYLNEVGVNQRIINLLNEYSQLQDNWDQDGAVAPSNTAITKSKYLAHVLEKRGQAIFHAAPGPNGEIMLDLRNYNKSRSLEILFYKDKAVSVLFPEDGKPSQTAFEFERLPELLQWLNKK